MRFLEQVYRAVKLRIRRSFVAISSSARQKPALRRGSDRRAVSCHGCRQTLLPVCRKGKTCTDIFPCQFREVIQDLFLGHAGGEILEHVGDRDPHSTDARLAAPLSRLNRDDLQVIHAHSILLDQGGNKNSRSRRSIRLCRTPNCRSSSRSRTQPREICQQEHQDQRPRTLIEKPRRACISRLYLGGDADPENGISGLTTVRLSAIFVSCQTTFVS